jgi:pyrimidine-nucleoside phosphorylase
MTPYELIRATRDGRTLAPEDIRALLMAYARGDVPDGQMAALCMAVWFRGLEPAELRAWTEAMLHSGSTLALGAIPGRKVDKHSTGGVGDKISLCLAPLVAACGVVVPMVAGRGLGHTGGTLDKLASIPGFRTDLSLAQARAQLEELGVCVLGQTEELAPADRRLYALRDVTATVDSIPLIAASIVSKKLAEDLDGLVLDVKVGSGAFMRRREDAQQLGRTLVSLAAELGCRTVAWLTSMDAPLGRAVGNALALLEAVEVLRGSGPADVVALTLRLGGEMLVLGGAVSSVAAGEERLQRAIADGSGLARFRALVERQGGEARAPSAGSPLGRLEVRGSRPVPRAGSPPRHRGVPASARGGGGADRADAAIDWGVGFTCSGRSAMPSPASRYYHIDPAPTGEAVERGRCLRVAPSPCPGRRLP